MPLTTAAASGGGHVWVSEYGAPYLLEIDPRTNRVVGKTGIGSGSCGLGYGAGSLWIEDTSSSTVSRVSTATGKRVKAIPVGSTPSDTTFAYGGRLDDRIRRGRARAHRPEAEPRRRAPAAAAGDRRRRRVRLGLGGRRRRRPARRPGWTAASADAVWVTTPTGLARIDPLTNAVTTTVALGARSAIRTSSAGWSGCRLVPSWKGSDVWRFRPSP